MSLRTRINGFTAWVNLRLTPYNQLLNNVLMDLLTGTHMKYFVESFTGRDLKKLENMDGYVTQRVRGYIVRAPDKMLISICKMPISSPNPMFYPLLESSHRDDSNKWSNIGFGEEMTEVETINDIFCMLIGALMCISNHFAL